MSNDDATSMLDGAKVPPDNMTKYLDRRKGCPVASLGHSAGMFYFLSPVGELRVIAGEKMNEAGLRTLLLGDVEWLVKNWPRPDKGPWSFYAGPAAEWLQRECKRSGLWDDRVPIRGVGVWPAGKQPEDGLLVHAGSDILLNGNWRRAGIYHGGAIYPARPSIERPTYPPATSAEACALREMLSNWNFSDPAGPMLFMGFLGTALLGGVPPWRPHIFVHAQFGSGKTWLAEWLLAALGPMAQEEANDFTEAGLRQALSNEARALVLDEAESDENFNRMGRVVNLLRRMSQGGGARSLRGSAEGRAHSFRVVGSVALFSIMPPAFKPADRSRFTMLELRPLDKGPEAADGARRARDSIAQARELSFRLWQRALEGWPRYCATREKYRAALMADASTAREADQFSALFAGHDLLCEDVIPDDARVASRLQSISRPSRRRA